MKIGTNCLDFNRKICQDLLVNSGCQQVWEKVPNGKKNVFQFLLETAHPQISFFVYISHRVDLTNGGDI